MPSVKLLIGGILLTLCLVHGIDALQCYSCFATGGGSHCEQYSTYEQAYKNNDAAVMKNCSAPFDQICYIETYSNNGGVLSHIRDCNNGGTFSFSYADKPQRYTRLNALTANNETSCVWDANSMVCLTKCDTDFCNGPLYEVISSGVHVMISPLVLIIGFVISLSAL